MSEKQASEEPISQGGMSDATRTRLIFLAPLIAFIAIVIFLARGLFFGEPQVIPSVLIGKPAPEFALSAIVEGGEHSGLSKADLMTGEVVILNVWASWCGPCRIEHPLLMELAAKTSVPIYGLNHKDKPEDALAFLAGLGNPYGKIGADPTGRVGIDFGVYGVPETYIINGKGDIVYRHVGPINQQDKKTGRATLKLLPKFDAALRAALRAEENSQ